MLGARLAADLWRVALLLSVDDLQRVLDFARSLLPDGGPMVAVDQRPEAGTSSVVEVGQDFSECQDVGRTFVVETVQRFTKPGP